jgi:hypothetical protein
MTKANGYKANLPEVGPFGQPSSILYLPLEDLLDHGLGPPHLRRPIPRHSMG